ncbi:hypothetical protein LXA43DRAFT_1101431 [Ganoderma leucocontextum]|nr:hypothetical protein LXA43DRAFT_1101431 [Ganoderma leucocontextum]
MSAAPVSAQDLSFLYTDVYCVYAACAILVYDWFLCLGQEVRFIWNWHSKVTSSSLVYALSRYAMLIEALLAVATAYPMSDLLMVVDWLFGDYVGPGGYLNTGNNCVRRILCPACLRTVKQEQMVVGDNHPFGTTANGDDHFHVVWRGSQLAAELLVVGITWWYSYQSYRMRKGIKLGKTISSLLIYNGSLYFLFLATLYVLGIIFLTASVPNTILNVADGLSEFYDPITSILVCRFMLELRQFDSSPASVTYDDSEMGSRVQEHTASRDVLQFAAQPSDSLPASIASFAHPVHVDSALFDSEMDPDAINDNGAEWQEMDVVAPTRTTASSQPESPAPEQPSELEHSV